MKSPSLKNQTPSPRRAAKSEDPAPSSRPSQEIPSTVRAPRVRIKIKPTHPAAPGKFQALRPITTVEVKIDVGFGNTVFIRGQGDGLSWEQGQPLSCLEACRWVWSSEHARGPVTFKLLLNDDRWALGEDLKVEAGQSLEVVPTFA